MHFFPHRPLGYSWAAKAPLRAEMNWQEAAGRPDARRRVQEFRTAGMEKEASEQSRRGRLPVGEHLAVRRPALQEAE